MMTNWKDLIIFKRGFMSTLKVKKLCENITCLNFMIMLIIFLLIQHNLFYCLFNKSFIKKNLRSNKNIS